MGKLTVKRGVDSGRNPKVSRRLCDFRRNISCPATKCPFHDDGYAENFRSYLYSGRTPQSASLSSSGAGFSVDFDQLHDVKANLALIYYDDDLIDAFIEFEEQGCLRNVSRDVCTKMIDSHKRWKNTIREISP